ncbi:hypothetical protein IL992_22795 [Microbispora sp. NEAU-D428]|uniref:hypothetical protein n=1 Tax=Microbispora sitophila TaxID=2771537 RepID=UPI0018682BB8|nr:hypothetical protein [Microbispora sitophila]MBE3012005.1 hypothetical protein [Microbispora sitophila]
METAKCWSCPIGPGLHPVAGVDGTGALGYEGRPAATVRGWAPDGLLDGYHVERHRVGAARCA